MVWFEDMIVYIIVIGGIAFCIAIIYGFFFKKRQYILVDEYKNLSKDLVKSNIYNTHWGYVWRNNKILFQIEGMCGYKLGKSDVYKINIRPLIIGKIQNPLKIHTLIVSRSFFTPFGKDIILHNDFSLELENDILYNEGDKGAIEYLDMKLDKMEIKMVRNGSYAQTQKNSIVDLSESTKDAFRQDKTELNTENLQGLQRDLTE